MKINSICKFIKEMLFGAGELIFANVESKIGFALMFLIIGIIFLLPREGEEKNFFLIVGIVALLNSIRLFVLRIKEMRNE